MTIADRLRIHCVCGRVVLIAVQGLNLPGYTRIKDIARLLRCDNCGKRDLTIVWEAR
jgi:hypothetical protein